MSTLKICSGEKVYWITGIKSLTQLGGFDVPHKAGGKYDDCEIYNAAFDANAMIGSCNINGVDFVLSTDDAHPYDARGISLKVEREGKFNEDPEIWLIPRRSAFLMSDSGATIDRI